MTGVSHWVEHMNFKGAPTARATGEGIMKRFGGFWNGVDRSDHLRRDGEPRRAGPDAVHRGRAHGQLPITPTTATGRTVIISGAGGGNDRSAARPERPRGVQGAPVRHPTIGWLSDLQTMTRGTSTVTTAATTCRTTRAGHRRRRGPRRRCAARGSTSGIRPDRPRGGAHRGAGADRRRVAVSREDDGVLEAGITPRGADRLLPLLILTPC